MRDSECVEFLQWTLPTLQMCWPGFRKVRRTVCKRVDRRMRELGLHDVAEYRAFLGSHPDEWTALDDWCRISISRFYRDRGVFDLLRREVLPDLANAAIAQGESELRVWSAGCASGEEPYTVQLIWRLALQARYPQLHMSILATDADLIVLERARTGCYPASSLKDLPADWAPRAFYPQGDQFCIRPEFRSGVEFQFHDIRHELPDGRFHLILCRYLVFTYYDAALQTQILERLCGRLAPNGVLATGKQEQLPSTAGDRLVSWSPSSGIYRVRHDTIEALRSDVMNASA